MRDIIDMQHNLFSKELTPCGGFSPHILQSASTLKTF